MKAYHASNAEITKFDFARLGEATAANGADEDAIRMARMGVWMADKALDQEMITDHLYEVEIDLDRWDVAEVTMEQLWQGTDIPEADIYIVEDDEFGCTSYIITEGAEDAIASISKVK